MSPSPPVPTFVCLSPLLTPNPGALAAGHPARGTAAPRLEPGPCGPPRPGARAPFLGASSLSSRSPKGSQALFGGTSSPSASRGAPRGLPLPWRRQNLGLSWTHRETHTAETPSPFGRLWYLPPEARGQAPVTPACSTWAWRGVPCAPHSAGSRDSAQSTQLCLPGLPSPGVSPWAFPDVLPTAHPARPPQPPLTRELHPHHLLSSFPAAVATETRIYSQFPSGIPEAPTWGGPQDSAPLQSLGAPESPSCWGQGPLDSPPSLPKSWTLGLPSGPTAPTDQPPETLS